MILDTFIQQNGVLPADAVVVKKAPFKLLNHYIIYLGWENGRHIFIANYKLGTRILSNFELASFSRDFTPHDIVRFQGKDLQRYTAVQRALSRRDQSSYHLLLNNCEHFSNYVQTGIPYSQQTRTLGSSLVVTGLLTAASTRNANAQAVGIIAAVLGLVTLAMDDNKQ